MNTPQHTPNHLNGQTSPYLLQHLYNPVDWYPWGEEALSKAKNEDKPIIVSIGYSACHWCHVMEKESFENESIAKLMNEKFVCIKVDREERPDVDQIYMDALHYMSQRGGWPLNCFLTPLGKPFYGGTYFPPSDWTKLLENILHSYKNRRTEIDKAAEDVSNQLNKPSLPDFGVMTESSSVTEKDLRSTFQSLQKQFDFKMGGFKGAPKFPMPVIYKFLLRYYHITKDVEALNHITLTLDKMAEGGIYDQVGGGFARYSTDHYWLVPHFEKMLYDNAQLISLYSEAWQITKSEHYKRIVESSLTYIQREMTSPEGGFFSSQDADSEGKEGFYYLWTKQELIQLLGKDEEIFSKYFNVTESGNWEYNANILNRSGNDTLIASTFNITKEELQGKIKSCFDKILAHRLKRIKPGLDDKILASWNGIMLKAYVDAYRIFNKPEYLMMAEKNAEFIYQKMMQDSMLWHNYKNNSKTITGMLEDYAFVIDGFTALYEATFNDKWLITANLLSRYVMDHFYDPVEKMFFFTADNAEKLISRKKEIYDNVIPASNSQMAINLYRLGLMMDNSIYMETAKKIFETIKPYIEKNTQYMANWACLAVYKSYPTAEVILAGENIQNLRKQLDLNFIPNMILMGTNKESNLPLLANKYVIGKNRIFVCYNKTCKSPVETVKEAMKIIAKE